MDPFKEPCPEMIGVDLGGTKIEAAALAADGTMLVRRRVPTPSGDYPAILAAIGALVAGLEREFGAVPGIGVGIPGSLSPRTGLVRNANSTSLNGRPLARDLETALAKPVRIENDANCLAVSEAADGAGADAHVVFAVILGTGCGAGIAIDARALSGRGGVAGEFGHNPLPSPAGSAESPGPACWCGRRGCLETYLSGPGFSARHAEATGASLSSHEIMTLARAGDAAAAVSFKRYVSRLGRALAAVVNLLDPDVIVLGGGMSNIGELYGALPDAIAPHVFSDSFDTPVIPAAHGDSSGVRGAAWLWKAR